ncbi:MAG: DUF4157 domain-containing protein [Nostoc sp. ChiSLP02]|nr:DUF4157 domain-containing protein [Nostoc sp. DedSLP05]MDZ8100293.1 DUF4157 domain-containing protein [Nostoc sp. DedSLP01]MDZ8188958.1 DUF4157 domain-containing protein [Nostoc sp. ChiSLP02]
MSDRTFGRQKIATSTSSSPSLVSRHTPTLANPVRGFGLPTNNIIQTATEESTNFQQGQSPSEQSSLSQPIEQRSFGHDISRIALRRPQAKLMVGEPGDKYEQQAEQVANQVMRMAVPNKLNTPSVESPQDSLQRKCAACEQEEDKVQTKSSPQQANDRGFEAGDNVESRLNSTKGGGSPLPNEVRSFMEPRFGTDFSQVRVHTDSEAVQMNQDLSAQAFTYKHNIYFGAGKAPAKDTLTAHELTHVVQQTGGVQLNQASKPSVQMKCSDLETEEVGLQRAIKVSAAPIESIQRETICDDTGCHEELDPVTIEGDPNAPIELDPVTIEGDPNAPIELDPVIIEGEANPSVNTDTGNLPGTDLNSCVEQIDEDVAACADEVNKACALKGAAETAAGAVGGALIGSIGGPVGAGIGGMIGTVAGGVYGALDYGDCVKEQNKGCRDAGKLSKKKCAQQFSN